MAKDGTNRGGRRIRAGDKPEALADKIAKGKAATIIDLPTPILEGADLNDAADPPARTYRIPATICLPGSGTASRSVRMTCSARPGNG